MSETSETKQNLKERLEESEARNAELSEALGAQSHLMELMRGELQARRKLEAVREDFAALAERSEQLEKLLSESMQAKEAKEPGTETDGEEGASDGG